MFTAYWGKLKQRLKEEGNETVTICHGLKLRAADGKMRMTDVVDTEQLFRIIQSIPSPKAEPFKLWMAHVTSQCFLGMLANQVAFYLRNQPECECQHLALNIIAKSVVVLDSPHLAFLFYTKT